MVRPKMYWLAAKVRRTGIMLLAVPVVALTGFVFTKTAVLNHYAAAQTTPTPFVLEMETYILKDNPEGELIHRNVLARRSDGASVEIGTVFGRRGLEEGLTGRRLTFIDGRSISLLDWLQSKTTWPQPSVENVDLLKARIFNPPANCLGEGETLLGSDSVLGQATLMIRDRPMGRGRDNVLACAGFGLRGSSISH